jgi:hypothetical protein
MRKSQFPLRRFLIGVALSVFSSAAAFGQVALYPGDDLQAAVDNNPEGTTFVLAPGLYRLQQVNPKDGDTFIGLPGAVMNGAELLTDFRQETVEDVTYWVGAPGPTTPGQLSGECDPDHPACIYPEDLFIDDTPLTQVNYLQDVVPGKCFFDYPAGEIYFLDDPTGHTVEVSVARHAFGGTFGYAAAPNVTIRGLVIEKYASPGDMGAVGDQFGGDNWTIENNEIRFNHGAGVMGTTGNVIRDNYIHDNGQIGITGAGTANGAPDILVENNEISGNNYAGFGGSYGSGGVKFSFTRSLTVQNNYVHDNNGPGLWTDTGNYDTLYENNQVAANMGVGIWHELSYDVTIRYNTLIRNGLSGHPWLYASQILIANSRNGEVYNNLAVVDGNLGTTGNPGNGIAILQDDRSEDGPDYYTVNNYIHDNVVTYLGDRGLSGAGADMLPGDPYDPRIMYDGNNLFDYNTYHDPSGPNGWRWNWKCDTAWDCWLDWANFQAQGQEPHGVVDTDVEPLDAPAPPAPNNLAVETVSTDQVELTWNPCWDPWTGGAVAGYRVFRDGVPYAMTMDNSFLDTDVDPNTSYTYAVTAYNEVGNASAQSRGTTTLTPDAGKQALLGADSTATPQQVLAPSARRSRRSPGRVPHPRRRVYPLAE